MADSTPSWSTNLLQKLDSIEPLGNFVASMEMKHYPRSYPRLEVEGSRVGLPLDPMVAAHLKDKSKAAPFGRGEKTVYDESVRKAYQFDPSQVSLGGEKWDEHIHDAVVPTIAYQLGYPREQASKSIRANLYKMLLYSEGCSDLIELSETWFKSATEDQRNDKAITLGGSRPPESRRRLGYKLNHRYSPNEFSWDSLRGRDAVLAHSLRVVSDRLGKPIFRLRLVLIGQIQTYCRDELEEVDSGTRKVVDSDGTVLFDDSETWSSNWRLELQENGWLYQINCGSNWVDSSTEDPLFNGFGYADYRHEETGNEGTKETYWYYAAAILLEPMGTP